MPGERLMSEGTTAPEAETTAPGSSPEHKKSYTPPTPEEKARLEALGKPLVLDDISSPDRGGVRQPEAEITPEIPNVIDSELGPEAQEFIAKMKEIPWDLWWAISDAKRAEEGKPPAKRLQSDVSGVGQISPERARELELENERRREYAINLQNQEREGGVGIITKENWMEAERYDHALADNKDYLSVRILDQMGRHMWVYWPKDEQTATARVRDVIGRIELAREDVDPQLSLEYQRIQAILGAIKANKELARTLGESYINLNEQLNIEFKGRRTFHQAFFTYETQSSIEAIVKSAVTLGPNDFNALFAIEEKISGTNESFNPFVVALQFYEDHGHEFASNNSEIGRPKFGKQVLTHLAKYIADKKGIDVSTINTEDYKWAQNMAERFFRFSGRAEMYDYLVYTNPKTKEKQVVKYLDPEVHPVTGKKVDDEGNPIKEKIPVGWASDRDGCDYDITKIIRLREFLRQEGGLRTHASLLNGVDTFGGDFLTRTLRADKLAKDGKLEIPCITYRVPKEELEERIKAKIKDLIDKDKKAPDEAKEIATKLYREIDEQNQLYAEVDSFADRDDINQKGDNKGEQVGHVNFDLFKRTKKTDGTGYEGFDFKSKGTTPLGLWVTRYVNGPEALRNALAGKAESFLINPNTESYRALIDAFGFQKIPSHENLRQLAINLIDFSQNKRKEKTGRPNLNRTEIVAMVNDLSGLTDPNKPAVFNMEDREEVLQKALGRYWRLINIATTVKDGIIGFILGVLGHILKQGFSDVGK